MGRGVHESTKELIDEAYSILEEIQPCSVRAVCYRLFTAGVIDSMEKRNVQKVGRALVYARENEIIPWEWIVDETREVERTPSFRDKKDFAKAVRRSFRRDFWEHQEFRIEIWRQKGTVRGTLAPVLEKYGIGFQVLHGFGSATGVHLSAESSWGEKREFLVFYIGDWACSALHMSEVDLPERMARYGGRISLRRIALTEYDVWTEDGIEGLPSFPASDKKKDPRYQWYIKKHGAKCWGLDAMTPVELRERAEKAIREQINWEAWERCRLVEEAEQGTLGSVMKSWEAMKERV